MVNSTDCQLKFIRIGLISRTKFHLGDVMNKKYLFIMLASAIFVAGFSSASFSLTGREIIDKSDALKDPNTAESSVIMLIKKGGSVMEKEFRILSKDYGPNDRALISFVRPTQIKLLTHTYKSKEDDQWLRLSNGRIKRIAQSDKDKSFVNSHFWYEDLASREKDDYNYTYTGDANAAGFDCYKVDSVRKAGGAKVYEKITVYARKSDCFIVRVDFYRGGKMLKYLENSDIRTIDGIITPFKAVMTMADNSGNTELNVKMVKYNNPIPDSQLVKESLR